MQPLHTHHTLKHHNTFGNTRRDVRLRHGYLKWRTYAAIVIAGGIMSACGLGGGDAIIYTGVGVEADLATRAEAAGVEIIASMAETTHTHTKLRITVGDEERGVPGDIGVDLETGNMTILHTHGNDGVIHVESPNADDTYTLAQFMHLWGIGGTLPDVCRYFTGNPYCTIVIESAGTGETGLDATLEDDDTIFIKIVALA